MGGFYCLVTRTAALSKMACNHSEHLAIDRRAFLVASGVSFCGLQLPGFINAAPSTVQPLRPTAKSTILIWLDGGASQIDTWDMKPDAPLNYRGEFQPIQTSTPGIVLCEHLPRLARQTNHLAIVRSVGQDVRSSPNNHTSGIYYNMTGHPPDPSFTALGENRVPLPDDWPFIGSVVAYKKNPHPYLPQLVTLPRKLHVITDKGGQYAARLGKQFDPLIVHGSRDIPVRFTTPALQLPQHMTVRRLNDRRQLLGQISGTERALEQSLSMNDYNRHQEQAFSLLFSSQTKKAFDIAAEPESVRNKYGKGVNAMSLLMARRLVEAGVPFVTVIWKKEDPELHKKKYCNGVGSWDTHGKNFPCLKDILLPNFDQMFAALLEDLSDRGLIDQTLVVVTSEMGRMPRIGDKRVGGASGRDHWRQCMSVLFAGGGIRGGQVYGSSDRLGEFPHEQAVSPADIAKTIYYAMGINDFTDTQPDGQKINLMEEGRPITELF